MLDGPVNCEEADASVLHTVTAAAIRPMDVAMIAYSRMRCQRFMLPTGSEQLWPDYTRADRSIGMKALHLPV
jgi:hypothetical protein